MGGTYDQIYPQRIWYMIYASTRTSDKQINLLNAWLFIRFVSFDVGCWMDGLVVIIRVWYFVVVFVSSLLIWYSDEQKE